MDFQYTVIRRRGRRTASITVAPDNSVTIVVPAHLTDADVAGLIRRKSPWISRKIAFNREVRQPYRRKEYVSGEAVVYLGRNYRLKVEAGNSPAGAELKGGRLCVTAPATLAGDAKTNWVRAQLVTWYQEHALAKVRERVALWGGRIGVKPTAVSVRDYTSRWGSCYRDRSVTLNWRIVMAPVRIIDYVVVHELCHLRHHHHAKAFWAMLALHMPDCAERKEWLRVNGGLLVV